MLERGFLSNKSVSEVDKSKTGVISKIILLLGISVAIGAIGFLLYNFENIDQVVWMWVPIMAGAIILIGLSQLMKRM